MTRNFFEYEFTYTQRTPAHTAMKGTSMTRAAIVIWGLDGTAIVRDESAVTTAELLGEFARVASALVCTLPPGNSVAVLSGPDLTEIEMEFRTLTRKPQ
jgi:hypothetical protein